MGIPVLIWQNLYIESAPWYLNYLCQVTATWVKIGYSSECLEMICKSIFMFPPSNSAIWHIMPADDLVTSGARASAATIFNLFLPQYFSLSTRNLLTYWGQVKHICVGKLIIIGSDNSLSPSRRQAIIWTNAGILLIRPLGTNFS